MLYDVNLTRWARYEARRAFHSEDKLAVKLGIGARGNRRSDCERSFGDDQILADRASTCASRVDPQRPEWNIKPDGESLRSGLERSQYLHRDGKEIGDP